MTCRIFSAAVLRQAEHSQAQRTIREIEDMSFVVYTFHAIFCMWFFGKALVCVRFTTVLSDWWLHCCTCAVTRKESIPTEEATQNFCALNARLA